MGTLPKRSWLDYRLSYIDIRSEPRITDDSKEQWLLSVNAHVWASQVVLLVQNLPANAGDIRDAGLIHGSGGSPEGSHSNPLQYSCQENPMDRGAWWATVHGVAKSWT